MSAARAVGHQSLHCQVTGVSLGADASVAAVLPPQHRADDLVVGPGPFVGVEADMDAVPDEVGIGRGV